MRKYKVVGVILLLVCIVLVLGCTYTGVVTDKFYVDTKQGFMSASGRDYFVIIKQANGEYIQIYVDTDTYIKAEIGKPITIKTK